MLTEQVTLAAYKNYTSLINVNFLLTMKLSNFRPLKHRKLSPETIFIVTTA
jgi:hypothetical protein